MRTAIGKRIRKHGHIGPLTIGLILAASSLVGCMPASRTAGTGDRAATDAEALREAQTDTGLPARRRKVLIAAESWLGTPYRYGGASLGGTDCSGFVRSVFAEVDVSLPRTSSRQATTGSQVGLEDVRPGDLLFFNTSGSGVSHVGIAIGRDRFVHASTSRGVIISSLRERYYGERYLFARSVL